MPLEKGLLINGIVDALSAASAVEETPATAREMIAAKIADAIDAFVRSGDVQAGISVSTTGSAVAQAGSTTSIGKIV